MVGKEVDQGIGIGCGIVLALLFIPCILPVGCVVIGGLGVSVQTATERIQKHSIERAKQKEIKNGK